MDVGNEVPRGTAAEVKLKLVDYFGRLGGAGARSGLLVQADDECLVEAIETRNRSRRNFKAEFLFSGPRGEYWRERFEEVPYLKRIGKDGLRFSKLLRKSMWAWCRAVRAAWAEVEGRPRFQ